VQLGIGQGSAAQLGSHMADSLVILNNKVTSAGRALEQKRSQNRLLQEQIEAMEVGDSLMSWAEGWAAHTTLPSVISGSSCSCHVVHNNVI
jgi:hypothetical protein